MALLQLCLCSASKTASTLGSHILIHSKGILITTNILMKRFVVIALLLYSVCLPSFGQIREIYDDGKIFDHSGGGFFISLGEAMFSYRVVYGRYPNEKRILLDYFLEVSKDEYDDFKADHN